MTDKSVKKSGELFNSGFCCAESVLMAVAEEMNIRSDLIPRIATGFCGGTSRTRGMCGAVSGAIMGINLIKGRQLPGQSQEDNYQAVQNLVAKFGERFGSVNCWELTGCDLGTEEGRNAFKVNNLHDRCTRFVQEATSLALKLMQEE
jgi:C_GCAxxG_C_C family probable redox protein